MFDQKTNAKWDFTLESRERTDSARGALAYSLAGARAYVRDEHSLHEGDIVAGFIDAAGRYQIAYHSSVNQNPEVVSALEALEQIEDPAEAITASKSIGPARMHVPFTVRYIQEDLT